jgi:ribosomal protein S18 acetylase RimI-like enzyme
MLSETAAFHEHEIAVAAEVLEDALRQGAQGHYQSYTAEYGSAPAGWICFGATPCTAGTFDIYWIAVDPAIQRRSLGTRLLAYAESRIAALSGRIAVIETSGRPGNEGPRAFYLSRGYAEAARVPDFYAPGDDRVTYIKRLEPPAACPG